LGLGGVGVVGGKGHSAIPHGNLILEPGSQTQGETPPSTCLCLEVTQAAWAWDPQFKDCFSSNLNKLPDRVGHMVPAELGIKVQDIVSQEEPAGLCCLGTNPGWLRCMNEVF
jgi:hypothetical protein